jgi:hypothetical protein
MSFTVNSVTSKGPWLVIDAYSTDVSTSTFLLANLTGNDHLVKSIALDFQKGQDDRWIKVFDGTDLQVGPVKPGVTLWSQDFGDGLTFEDGVYIQTESDAQIHVTMIYKIVPVLP